MHEESLQPYFKTVALGEEEHVLYDDKYHTIN